MVSRTSEGHLTAYKCGVAVGGPDVDMEGAVLVQHEASRPQGVLDIHNPSNIRNLTYLSFNATSKCGHKEVNFILGH